MNVFKRIGKAALDAASYITPNIVKSKIKTFTNWIRDYVDPSDLTQVLDEVKEYVKNSYKKEEFFDFDDNLFRQDNASLIGNFVLEKVSDKHNKKHNTHQDNYKVKTFRKKVDLSIYDLTLLFEQLVKRTKKQYRLDGHHLFRIIIEHVTLDHPISTKHLPVSEFDFDEIVKTIEYKEIPITECTITTEVIKIPRGTGRLQVTRNNLDQKRSSSQLEITIQCVWQEL